MGFLECNFHNHVESLNENGKRVIDVISHSSLSYLTIVHDTRPPVGLGGQLLPPLPTPKRMRVKSAARRMSVSNAWRAALIGPQARSQLAAMLGAQARSQGDQAAAIEANALVFVAGLFHSDIDDAADAVVTCLADVLIDVLWDSMTIAVETTIQARSQGDLGEERRPMNELKAYVQARRHCTATEVMLQDMPRELSEWIAAHPAPQ